VVSTDRGGDLARLASREQAELVLVDGRRPLVRGGAPGGEVGRLLAEATTPIAVLVARERVPRIDAEHPVVIPFAGSEDEWAALRFADRIADEMGARLRVGEHPAEEARDAGLLVIGLPRTGLPPGRATLARAGSAPVLFVRQ